MSTYLRPGINIVENLTASTSGTAATSLAAACFVAASNRGAVTPTVVNSWASYQTLFGGFNPLFPNLALAVYTYFNSGGGPCYVMRVAHSDAVTATRILVDGSAVNTLTINAANPGGWGNSITIDIVAGYTTGRFSLVVHYGGAVVEQFNDLCMTSTDQRYAPLVINGASVYIAAVDNHSVTAAPGNAPVAQLGTALATGADGTTPVGADYGTVTTVSGVSTVTSGPLSLLPGLGQPLILNLPSVTDSTTLNIAQTLVALQSNIFLVVDSPSGDTVSQVETFAAGLVTEFSTLAAPLSANSYAAVYYPWYNIADPTRPTSQGATVLVPPGGAVLGVYVSNDVNTGPFQTPAGTQANIPGALSLATTLQPSDYDSLNSSSPPVNALKAINGYGICIFGGRTLQGGFPSQYIAIRRSLIYIEQSLLNLTQYAVFQPNDSVLWASLDAVCTQWLDNYFAQGGLAGDTVDQAFFVTCDSSNNTPASVATGVANISIGVALEYPAEWITITIGQYQSGTSTSTTSIDDN